MNCRFYVVEATLLENKCMCFQVYDYAMRKGRCRLPLEDTRAARISCPLGISRLESRKEKVLKGFWPYDKSFILAKFIRSRWLHFSRQLVALPYSLRSRRLEVVSRSVSLGSSVPFFLVPTTLLLYPGNGSK